MSYAEADFVVQAVMDGCPRPTSVDPALWESTCQLYAGVKDLPKEQLSALLEEMSATRH